MTFLDLCESRCSLRKYDPARPVPRDIIDRCLEAARLAPSACNSQPWSFVVVDEPDKRDALAKAAFGGAYAMNRFARDAPVLIVCVTERSLYAARLGGFFRGMQYNLIDVGVACEHICLQAAEEGVGTCWLGWFNEKAVIKTLALPARTRVDVVLSMGYAAKAADRKKRRKDLDAIRRYA